MIDFEAIQIVLFGASGTRYMIIMTLYVVGL
jgi:hypothetical protein